MSEVSAEIKGLVHPTSSLLEMHLEHIIAACQEILKAAEALKGEPPESEERDHWEARIYVAICHLQDHVKYATEEWDRIEDMMPDD